MTANSNLSLTYLTCLGGLNSDLKIPPLRQATCGRDMGIVVSFKALFL